MDPAALATELRPVRWPVPTEAEGWADGLLAFGLGLLAALALYGLLRLVLARRNDPRRRLRGAIAAARPLAPAERHLALARLAARELPPGVAPRPALEAGLYLPEPGLDLDAEERRLARALGV
ncbi:MAG: hypothetical protein QM699_00365 [Amaricoccus sp.]|uniref:hypothetical protein n=1 Tax=Amaricoccus sp. TaxID=1872485 RepID=UPI0039E44FEB